MKFFFQVGFALAILGFLLVGLSNMGGKDETAQVFSAATRSYDEDHIFLMLVNQLNRRIKALEAEINARRISAGLTAIDFSLSERAADEEGENPESAAGSGDPPGHKKYISQVWHHAKTISKTWPANHEFEFSWTWIDNGHKEKLSNTWPKNHYFEESV